jgi:hypothetical protein
MRHPWISRASLGQNLDTLKNGHPKYPTTEQIYNHHYNYYEFALGKSINLSVDLVLPRPTQYMKSSSKSPQSSLSSRSFPMPSGPCHLGSSRMDGTCDAGMDCYGFCGNNANFVCVRTTNILKGIFC